MSDPFDTAALRAAALAAWSTSPGRFREDANAEEDHARGYYRDRVVVELAQNAADAAARAGEPGRLLLELRRGPGPGDPALLVAANTGAPLDAAGVASLASLRASAKRDEAAVGRFGVGFAAVRSVSDAVTVASTSGAVGFALDAARDAVAGPAAGAPDLAAEVAARGPWLPVLRLPFPARPPAGVPAPGGADGWATVVTLVLRDAAAEAGVRAQLAAVDDALLLALPALAEVRVAVDGTPPRVLRDVAERWVVARRAGAHPPALLADRPVEERDRLAWQVTWAVGRDAPTPPGQVHAPTPTDDRCSVPAMLVGTFPLDPTRRHVAPGPVTDALVLEAGRAWADLLAAVVAGTGPPPLVDLLPAGLPAGPLDAALVAAVLAATRTAPVLAPAAGGPPVAPADAVVLATTVAPGLVRALGRAWPTLVDLAPTERRVVRLLEIATTEVADAVAGLPDPTPEEAPALYDVCAGADPATLEQLATLPVPLADGRTVRGARGLLLVDDADDEVVAVLADWGLRVVHPAAAHPLLERLGAERTGVAALARSGPVRARLLAAPDEAEGFLALVRAAVRADDGAPPPAWWGEVRLPAEDGDLLPARGLVVAGSVASDDLDPGVLPAVDAAVQERWGADVLAAVGVRAGLAEVDVSVDQPAELAESLDGWAAYLAETGLADGPVAVEVPVVADLDAVRDDAWPRVLERLAREHRRVLEPVRAPGRDDPVPAYTAWWLRERGGLGLARPFAVGPAAPPWLPPPPAAVAGLDDAARRLLGGVRAADELTAADWAALLDELDEGDPVPLALAVELWRAIARRCAVGARRAGTGGGAVGVGRLADVGLLPGLTPDGVRAVPAEDVGVADPMWAQRLDCGPLLVVPTGAVGAVADGLDLDRADERAPGRVTSDGEEVSTPAAVREVFAAAPASWVEHDDLRVDGAAVDWWLDARLHAATPAGLASGLGAVVGARHTARIARLVAEPGAVGDVLLELAGDDA